MIPVRTNRAHIDPYWLGDSLKALTMAKKSGHRYIDQNGLLIWSTKYHRYVCAMAHWPRPWKEGYRFYWTGKYRHGREVRVAWHGSDHITVDMMDWEFYSRLRITDNPKHAGYWKKPTSLYQHLRAAQPMGIQICWELKAINVADDHFRTQRGWDAVNHEVALAKTHKPYIMTLQNLGDPWGRLRLAHDNGYETAILPRGHQPGNWANNQAKYVDRVWGHWS